MIDIIGQEPTGRYDLSRLERVAALEEVNLLHDGLEGFMRENEAETAVADKLEHSVSVLKGITPDRSSAVYALEEANLTFSKYGQGVKSLQTTNGLEHRDPNVIIVAAIEEKMNFIKALYLKAATFVTQLINKVKTYAGKVIIYFSSKAKSLDDTIKKLEGMTVEELKVDTEKAVGIYDKTPVLKISNTPLFEAMTTLWETMKNIDIKGISEKEVGKGSPLDNKVVTDAFTKKLTGTKTFLSTTNGYSSGFKLHVVSFSDKKARLIIDGEQDGKRKVRSLVLDLSEVVLPGTVAEEKIKREDVIKTLKSMNVAKDTFSKAFDTANKQASEILKEIRADVTKAREGGYDDNVKFSIAFKKVLASSGFGACMDLFSLHRSFSSSIVSFVDTTSPLEIVAEETKKVVAATVKEAKEQKDGIFKRIYASLTSMMSKDKTLKNFEKHLIYKEFKKEEAEETKLTILYVYLQSVEGVNTTVYPSLVLAYGIDDTINYINQDDKLDKKIKDDLIAFLKKYAVKAKTPAKLPEKIEMSSEPTEKEVKETLKKLGVSRNSILEFFTRNKPQVDNLDTPTAEKLKKELKDITALKDKVTTVIEYAEKTMEEDRVKGLDKYLMLTLNKGYSDGAILAMLKPTDDDYRAIFELNLLSPDTTPKEGVKLSGEFGEFYRSLTDIVSILERPNTYEKTKGLKPLTKKTINRILEVVLINGGKASDGSSKAAVVKTLFKGRVIELPTNVQKYLDGYGPEFRMEMKKALAKSRNKYLSFLLTETSVFRKPLVEAKLKK